MRNGTYTTRTGERVRVQRTETGYRLTYANGRVEFLKDEVAK